MNRLKTCSKRLAALLLGIGLAQAAVAQTPDISLGNASAPEGNAGITTLNVPVTRTGDSVGNIGLRFQTNASPVNPATAGTDYVAVPAGSAVLPAGASSVNLPISLTGDTEIELDEQFLVHLLSATNAGPTPVFAPASGFATGTAPRFVAVGDINGDGLPDLAVANTGSGSVSVLLNTTAPGAASASFAAQTPFGTGSLPTSVAVGDLNGDGRPDLAVANLLSNNVSVLLNTTAPGAASASFAAQAAFGTGTRPLSVAVGDLNGDGRPDLAVANEVSNNVSILLNTTESGAASASFAAQTPFGTGTRPSSVAVGDLNGDGRPDLAVANSNSNSVSVLLNATAPGAASASFATQTAFATGSFPLSVAVDDLNGDGRPDLAVANYNSGNVSALLNTTAPGAASASFAAQPPFGTGSGPFSVAVGDLNGDGRPDLAVANQFQSNSVSVLLNATLVSGNSASFGAPTGFGTPFNSQPPGVAVGDLNGDGRPDLAAALRTSNAVSVALNTTAPGAASASFSAQTGFGTGLSPRSVAAGDLNGDGRLDLAVANADSNNVSVLLNTTAPGAASASFATQTAFGTGSQPRAVAMGDLNGDGRPDLAVANSGSASVSVLLNTTAPGAASPSFAAQTSFGTGLIPLSVVVGDLNGDGHPDLAVANQDSNNVSVLLNTTAPGAASASFAEQTVFGTSSPRFLAAGDFNGDGRLDLAAANVGGSVSVLLNATDPGAASASFAAQTSFGTGSFSLSVAVGDLNGDGRPDLVVANESSSNVSVLLNTTAAGATSASFAAQTAFGTGGAPAFVTMGDLNGDGRPDLAVANRINNSVTVLLNQLYPVTVSGNEATATILNDDQPSLSINDVSLDEGNDGTTAYTFTVSLSQASPGTVTVNLATADGTATVADGDYSALPLGTTLSFDPGQTSKTVTVDVTGDTRFEPDESFTVTLSGASGATILDGSGLGNIVNDDVLDNTPEPFSFASQLDVARGSFRLSDPVTLTSIDFPTPFLVVNGFASVNGGDCTRIDDAVAPGDVLRLCHTASANFGTDTVTTVTVGTYTTTFTSTTLARDITPDAFSFISTVNQEPGSAQLSNAVTITGINDPTPFSVVGGFAAVGSGVCIQTSGTISNGQTLRLCHTAAADFTSTVTTTVTVGAEAPLTGLSRSFSSTTRAAGGPVYVGTIQQPINADGSSTFNSKKGVVPVKFTLKADGVSTCTLPPATIRVSRLNGSVSSPIDETDYLHPSDSGSNFRITDCQYHYNVNAKSFGNGKYTVELLIGGEQKGIGRFELK